MSTENLTTDELAHLPNDKALGILKPTIAEVDLLADELVTEFDNPKWRQWYCGCINRYGIEQILDWRETARKGNHPAKLFSALLSNARDRGIPEVHDTASSTTEPDTVQSSAKNIDTVYNIADNPSDADIRAFVSEQIDLYLEGSSRG